MKNILILLCLSLALSSCSTAPEDNSTLETEITEENLTYLNEEYGFQLELPTDWEGYTVVEEELSYGDYGLVQAYDFILEENSLMKISIFSKEQWQDLIDSESMMPRFLDENKIFVFAGDGSQDADESVKKQRAQVDSIFESFIAL